ncbi:MULTISPECIES: TadE/TadG family type IV pilus assembly protein [Massilia]|uniref:Pilus assembly protein n=1 Tax=Massilia haematophila TaxID=457923 RepID=A0ABV7PDT6_9BURK|nr:pilus assembly protein [Massilia sp.]HBZ05238.1 hypothetical protein [Massilia sp.]
MTGLYRSISVRRQDGSVAVEAAIIITLILVPLLAFILFFGRYFWYYTVAQKAVHDASLAMATLPLAHIRAGGAEDLAERIIGWETEDFDEMTRATLAPAVDCWYRFPASATTLTRLSCNNATLTPVDVRASLVMTVSDPFLAPFTGPVAGLDGLPIITQVSMRYVGR